MEIAEDGFIFSDDKNRIDPQAVHHYLSKESYWAQDIPLEVVRRSIENSLCFGIYKEARQIGFARWITDRATFGYLADVYVLPEYRGLGLSKKLMSLMLFHPDLQGLRRYMLGTQDAHGLYAQFGFKAVEHPERLMAIVVADAYKQAGDQ
ncbi:GNAT family N-acetyltransferase [Pedobacter deserti]|uniref:GNAT family N-acetyltransferase n=1 Tax=Pedobacter deserti TaxID=2817382 RepID=UPI002109B900|nr:GNAT family N-acetyltransferase [Pedobacter sp. SYSU D00382]